MGLREVREHGLPLLDAPPGQMVRSSWQLGWKGVGESDDGARRRARCRDQAQRRPATGGRWSSCTASPTTRAASTGSPSCWPMPARTSWCPRCGATAGRGSSTRRPCARVSRRRSRTTWWSSSTRWGSRPPSWPATTGAVARPAWWLPVAGTGVGAGQRQRLPAAGHRGQPDAVAAAPGAQALVPVLPARGAGPRGSARAPRGARPPAVGGVVAHLAFTDEEFEATRPAFDNPDFVDVVVHSYRHRYGLVDGDPAYDDTERRIAELPAIAVPTIVLDGVHDTVAPALPARSTSRTSPRWSTTGWWTPATTCRRRRRRSSPGRAWTCG